MASEFQPEGGKFVVARQFISTSVEDSSYLFNAILGKPFAARPSSSAKVPYLLDGLVSVRMPFCSFCLSPALGITCKLRPFPFVSISRVHIPDLCCAAPTVSQDHAVQLVNEKSSPAMELADDSPADDYKSV